MRGEPLGISGDRQFDPLALYANIGILLSRQLRPLQSDSRDVRRGSEQLLHQRGAPLVDEWILTELGRCPHCSIASPNMVRAWASQGPTQRTDDGSPSWWGGYRCQSCGGLVIVKAQQPTGNRFILSEIFPDFKSAHGDLPARARVYLQQAYETLHAPDAAAVMAGSAVDAMLKAKGYEKGTLYERIDKALSDNLLTKGMADWAHEVRLGSNRPRHADKDNPHVSFLEATQSVDFAEALGNFLFVLTARIDRGLKAATVSDAKP